MHSYERRLGLKQTVKFCFELLQVVVKLHSFLGAIFPEEYSARAVETAEEEAKDGVASPDFSLEKIPTVLSTPAAISLADFSCDACGELLYQPTILNCGHVVCGTPCLAEGKEKAPPGYEVLCPHCSGLTHGHTPQVCTLLLDFLQGVFPVEYAARAREAAVAVELHRKKSDLAKNNDADGEEEEEEEHDEDDGGQKRRSDEVVGEGAQEEAEEEAEQSSSSIQEPIQTQHHEGEPVPPPPPPPLPSVPEGLTGPHAAIWQWLHGTQYTHFAIGCDSCGAYPIVGRRYRCIDCPEAVGFDLCGDCYDRGVGGGTVVGRFNQRHTAEHTIEQTRPRMTSLHLLRAANPELSFDQLMSLLEMSSGGGGGGGRGVVGDVVALPTRSEDDEVEIEMEREMERELEEAREDGRELEIEMERELEEAREEGLELEIEMERERAEAREDGRELEIEMEREMERERAEARGDGRELEIEMERELEEAREEGLELEIEMERELEEAREDGREMEREMENYGEILMPRWRGPRPVPVPEAVWPSPSAAIEPPPPPPP